MAGNANSNQLVVRGSLKVLGWGALLLFSPLGLGEEILTSEVVLKDPERMRNLALKCLNSSQAVVAHVSAGWEGKKQFDKWVGLMGQPVAEDMAKGQLVVHEKDLPEGWYLLPQVSYGPEKMAREGEIPSTIIATPPASMVRLLSEKDQLLDALTKPSDGDPFQYKFWKPWSEASPLAIHLRIRLSENSDWKKAEKPWPNPLERSGRFPM